MIGTAIPSWKKRFVVLWYDFIRSETAYKAIKPIITRTDDSLLTNEEMTETIIGVARDYGLPEECWRAVIRYYSYPQPTLDEITAEIEPITISSTENGIEISVSKYSTQSELEEFIRINYSKAVPPPTSRMRISKTVRNIQIVNKRLVHGQSYKEIAEYMLDNGVDMEEPNIRSVVAAHKKRIKEDSTKPMR